MNYCLKGPDDRIVGFRLDVDTLGHEIYDLLDWADEHFSSHVVEQTDGCVYVCSQAAQETLSSEEVRAEPLSMESGSPGDGSGRGPERGGPSGGGSSGGSSGGGSSGGSGGSGPGGSTVGSSGGGTVAETAGR